MRKISIKFGRLLLQILILENRKCKNLLNQEDRKCMVPKRLQVQETIRRYQKIDKIISQIISKKPQFKEF
jgi:hypothetical protein